MEFKDLVEWKLRGRPLPESLPLDVRKEIEAYIKLLQKHLPFERLADAICFFAEKKGLTPHALKEMIPQLLDDSKGCRKYGNCYAPIQLKRQWRKCWFCPQFEETHYEDTLGIEI